MGCVLSGIQPTGKVHLGNYLGAIKNWIKLQKEHNSLFCIVDLHALTVCQTPMELRKSTLMVTAAYLACGVDPKISTIFLQSSVSGHSKLSWLLGCKTPLGWLNRMIQFKEKLVSNNLSNQNLGLYSYPVLMAADILLYKATHVPVGNDQAQHLEITRDIAITFNSFYKKDLFPIPEYKIGNVIKIMSLRNGNIKMSKSENSDFSRINLLDTADQIYLKIKKAKTDSLFFPETVNGLKDRPEAKNLINIYSLFANITHSEVCNKFAGYSFSNFKPILSDLLISELEPISIRMKGFLTDHEELIKILRAGSEKANNISEKTIKEVYNLIGLLSIN